MVLCNLATKSDGLCCLRWLLDRVQQPGAHGSRLLCARHVELSCRRGLQAQRFQSQAQQVASALTCLKLSLCVLQVQRLGQAVWYLQLAVDDGLSQPLPLTEDDETRRGGQMKFEAGSGGTSTFVQVGPTNQMPKPSAVPAALLESPAQCNEQTARDAISFLQTAMHPPPREGSLCGLAGAVLGPHRRPVLLHVCWDPLSITHRASRPSFSQMSCRPYSVSSLWQPACLATGILCTATRHPCQALVAHRHAAPDSSCATAGEHGACGQQAGPS